jgi:hypothetical protein
MSREQLAAQNVDHGAGPDLPVDRRCDAHGEERNAVEEVDRPVERIDHPLQAGARFHGAGLFSEDPRPRRGRKQEGPHALLGANVGLGDHIGRRRLAPDWPRLPVRGHHDLGRGPRGGGCNPFELR